ncbi:hypothetical protein CFP56_011335 [Quercus suber]|uniref:Uncharacterized protein n=1 Tax=Quercus suber TaxID=58331 RepID=A0AAW0MEU9_QUESU
MLAILGVPVAVMVLFVVSIVYWLVMKKKRVTFNPWKAQAIKVVPEGLKTIHFKIIILVHQSLQSRRPLSEGLPTLDICYFGLYLAHSQHEPNVQSRWHPKYH